MELQVGLCLGDLLKFLVILRFFQSCRIDGVDFAVFSDVCNDLVIISLITHAPRSDPIKVQ